MNGTASLQNRNISLDISRDALAGSPKANPNRSRTQTNAWWHPSQPTPDHLERSLALESIQSIASALLRI